MSALIPHPFDPRRLASVGGEGTVCTWDVGPGRGGGGRRVCRFENILTAGPQSETHQHGMSVAVLDGVFSPDGHSIAVADVVSAGGVGLEVGERGGEGGTGRESRKVSSVTFFSLSLSLCVCVCVCASFRVPFKFLFYVCYQMRDGHVRTLSFFLSCLALTTHAGVLSAVGCPTLLRIDTRPFSFALPLLLSCRRRCCFWWRWWWWCLGVFPGARQVGRFTVYGTGQSSDETVAGRKVRRLAVGNTGRGRRWGGRRDAHMGARPRVCVCVFVFVCRRRVGLVLFLDGHHCLYDATCTREEPESSMCTCHL